MSTGRTAIPLFFNSPKVQEWTTDAAHLPFLDYLDRTIWSPPNEKGSRECINFQLMHQPCSYMIAQQANEYRNGEDPHYGDWNRALEAGRNYLVGRDVSLTEFARTHRSSLNDWQRLAYQWCLANPSQALVLRARNGRLIYEIKKRGDYVEIGLPHHDHGGEKHWISRDGKTKVLINVD